MTPEEAAVAPAIDTDELLSDLRASNTDLSRLVTAVLRDRPPYVVVPIQAVMAWERREPEQWARVSEWLVAHSVSLVQI
jgi:hypothetical protein